MQHTTHIHPNKPYDIRERLYLFACDVIREVQKLHTRGDVAVSLSVQLADAAVGAAANAEESDDGSSRKDFIAKELICLRELKETRVRLRVMRATGYLDDACEALIQESDELIRIVATIIRKSRLRLEAEQQAKRLARRTKRPRAS